MTTYKFDMEGLIKSDIISSEYVPFVGKEVTIRFQPSFYSDLSFKYEIPKDYIYYLIGKSIYEAEHGKQY